ncbi:hypothetical protein [Micromonospora rifamycinica]|uniref:Esterase-like activity of phytase family protein n=1 Tax=Micromonospora rifamycinica TaxID=291594 RepID=A0A1C5H7H4_9ACTN|nr:hypothetical protein [Micromonospora rifamycinica]SCG41857.1 hypothetical protein GA0070623_0830 [Micromonospora rifamycinica]
MTRRGGAPARAGWSKWLLAALVVPAVVPAPAALPAPVPAAVVPAALPVPAPAALPGTARAAAADVACRVRDERLTEISGMVATDSGFVMVNDGADEASRRRIFFLDTRCAVVRSVPYPSRPRDTEDLAVGADGTVWVADIGDNDRVRSTVALWRLAPGSRRPVLHRLSYPDGPHDAEALLLGRDGLPVVVTKQGGEAGVYVPTGPPRAGVTVPMRRAGQLRLPTTTTANPYSFFGRRLVTGGATAPDGRRVVLRTYADAFEFDVPDGDVVAALTGGTPPRVVPLPDEPQGESVSYSRDGRWLLTVSETAGQPAGTRPTVLRYALPGGAASPVPSVSVAVSAVSAPATGSSSAPAPGAVDAGPHRADAGGVRSLLLGVGVIVAGLLLVASVGAARARRTGR